MSVAVIVGVTTEALADAGGAVANTSIGALGNVVVSCWRVELVDVGSVIGGEGIGCSHGIFRVYTHVEFHLGASKQ